MQFEKDAMLRIVKATRMSLKLAEDMKPLLFEKGTWTVPDQIAGFLIDALFMASGEKLQFGQDFWKYSKTMKILLDDTSDEEATDAMIALFDEWHPKIPGPILMTSEEKEALYGATH